LGASGGAGKGGAGGMSGAIGGGGAGGVRLSHRRAIPPGALPILLALAPLALLRRRGR
jgi:hypothetical protein